MLLVSLLSLISQFLFSGSLGSGVGSRLGLALGLGLSCFLCGFCLLSEEGGFGLLDSLLSSSELGLESSIFLGSSLSGGFSFGLSSGFEFHGALLLDNTLPIVDGVLDGLHRDDTVLVTVAVHVVAWFGVATDEAGWSTVHISV